MISRQSWASSGGHWSPSAAHQQAKASQVPGGRGETDGLAGLSVPGNGTVVPPGVVHSEGPGQPLFRQLATVHVRGPAGEHAGPTRSWREPLQFLKHLRNSTANNLTSSESLMGTVP
jgi:hypothetical protein